MRRPSILDMLDDFLHGEVYREERERFCVQNARRFFAAPNVAAPNVGGNGGGGEYTHTQYQIFELFRAHCEKLVTDRIPQAKLMAALRCCVKKRDPRGQTLLRILSDGVEFPALVAQMKQAQLALERADDPRLAPKGSERRRAGVLQATHEQLSGSDDDGDDLAFLEGCSDGGGDGGPATRSAGALPADWEPSSESEDEEDIPGAVR